MKNNYFLYLSGLISENEYFESHEKGEPRAHKEKVAKSHKENLEFFKARRSGSANFASATKEKGGPSILTYWHFSAKDAQYKEVLNSIEAGKDKKYFVEKYDSFMSKLHSMKFEQQKFQVVMGQLEVWGEAIAKLF